MKIKDDFMLRQFGEEYIVVAVGEDAEEFNKLITLNSVGAFIYKELEGGSSREKLADAIVNNYEIDRATAERDVDIFLENLNNAGLLDA